MPNRMRRNLPCRHRVKFNLSDELPPLAASTEETVAFRMIEAQHGIRLRVAVSGEGPLVLMVHGFPESWFSWRYQIPVISNAGFCAAALDVRGYGGSDKPRDVAAYSLKRLAADIAAVIDELSSSGRAILVGHDWGAHQVYATALLHPEKVIGLVSLSAPAARYNALKSREIWNEFYGDTFYYQRYFSTPEIAEREFQADPARALRIFYYALSSAGARGPNILVGGKERINLFDGRFDSCPLPTWLGRKALDYYIAEFEHSGFTGPLNRYRAMDIDVDDMAAAAHEMIEQPSLFIGGVDDPARYMLPDIDRYKEPVPRLTDCRGVHFIDGAGHWVQQEAPDKINTLLLSFLKSL